jgi:hypothetical protein
MPARCTALGCFHCQYALCGACAESPAPAAPAAARAAPTCPKAHPLTAHKVGAKAIKCRRCAASCAPRALMHGCHQCVYSLCPACFDRSPAVVTPAVVTPAVVTAAGDAAAKAAGEAAAKAAGEAAAKAVAKTQAPRTAAGDADPVAQDVWSALWQRPGHVARGSSFFAVHRSPPSMGPKVAFLKKHPALFSVLDAVTGDGAHWGLAALPDAVFCRRYEHCRAAALLWLNLAGAGLLPLGALPAKFGPLPAGVQHPADGPAFVLANPRLFRVVTDEAGAGFVERIEPGRLARDAAEALDAHLASEALQPLPGCPGARASLGALLVHEHPGLAEAAAVDEPGASGAAHPAPGGHGDAGVEENEEEAAESAADAFCNSGFTSSFEEDEGDFDEEDEPRLGGGDRSFVNSFYANGMADDTAADPYAGDEFFHAGAPRPLLD